MSTTLPADTTSSGVARRFLSDALAEWGMSELVSSANLLVSELVTNAVLHARTPIGLSVRCGEGRLRVEVADGDVRSPAPRRYDADAATGRGLVLVEELSSAWGAEPNDEGKVVWFEMSAPSVPGLPAEDGAQIAKDALPPPSPPGDATRPDSASTSPFGPRPLSRGERRGWRARGRTTSHTHNCRPAIGEAGRPR